MVSNSSHHSQVIRNERQTHDTTPYEGWGIHVTQTAPAGWYPDPENPTQQRYWDGAAWTQNVAPIPTSTPAIESPPPPQVPPAQTTPDLHDPLLVESAQPEWDSAPLVAGWKTSVGFSLLGLFLGFPLLVVVADRISFMLVQIVSVEVNEDIGWNLYFPFFLLICGVSLIVYAKVFYSSYFTANPISKSHELISLLNCAFGGPLFGLLWNRGLTKKEKRLSGSVAVGATMIAYFPVSLIAYFVA